MSSEPSLDPEQSRANALHARSDKSLAVLASLAAEFTPVLSLPDLLQHVMRTLHEELGFDSCTVSLLERHGVEDVLVVRAGSGLRMGPLGRILAPGEGPGWEILHAGAPVLVADLHADPRITRRDPAVRSAIYAPLTAHDRPIGVLCASRAAVNAFSESELHLLAIVSRYIAGAVEIARLHAQLRETATRDALTGLANRTAFLDQLKFEISKSSRADCSLSVVLMELDGLKVINDTYGHAMGDQALIEVGRIVLENVRASDFAARYGGDELALLLPDTVEARASDLLARLGSLDVTLPGRPTEHLSVDISWGVAAWPQDGESADEVLRAAGMRLHAMKRRPRKQDAPR